MTTNNAINNTLQTPFNVGATSVTSTGTQLNLLNGLTAVPINKIVIQKFSTPGTFTYTPSAGLVSADFECLGAGAGGGGIANASAGATQSAGGGGAGSYSRIIATAATIGSSQTVTVGSGGAGGNSGPTGGTVGGDSSVGSICIGKGGGGGGGGTAAVGGAGGVAGTGTVTTVGNAGGSGTSYSVITAVAPQGVGASSIFGGAPGMTFITGAAGLAATGFGSGGNGGSVYNASGGVSGGNGSGGLVIITEFISA